MPDDLDSRLLDALPDGVYFLDRRRRIVRWSRGAQAITGYDSDDVLGRFCGDALLNHVDADGASLCGTRCPLHATMVDGVPRSSRVFLHHSDGHLLPVLTHATVVRDSDGTVIGAVESFRDDTDHAHTETRLAELEQQAMLDPLTGIGNRRSLDGALAHRLARTAQEPFGFLLVDLDRFKRVNDRYGHDIGDQVLRSVALTLTAAVGDEGVVARFGGEELVVVTGPTDLPRLASLAERLRILVGHVRHRSNASVFQVTVSVGATLSLPDDTAATVLHRADQALLRAKRDGRDRTVTD